jgi:hypothetical protein
MRAAPRNARHAPLTAECYRRSTLIPILLHPILVAEHASRVAGGIRELRASQPASRGDEGRNEAGICEDGPEKDAVSAMRSRDAASEAREAAALRDFRVMAYMTAYYGGVSIKAVGTVCGPRPREYRAVLGFNVAERNACMHDYARAARAFVAAYNARDH